MRKLNVILAVQYLKECSLYLKSACQTYSKSNFVTWYWGGTLRRGPENQETPGKFPIIFPRRIPSANKVWWCSWAWKCSLAALRTLGSMMVGVRSINLCILFSLRPPCTNALFHANKGPFCLLGFFKTSRVFFWENILLGSDWLLFLRMYCTIIKWKLSRMGIWFRFEDTYSPASGNRSKAILRWFKIASALGVKMVDGRNQFFRIVGIKQLISSISAAREDIIFYT